MKKTPITIKSLCGLGGGVLDGGTGPRLSRAAAAGLEPHTVEDKYYFARRPEITRVVDVSGVIDQKIDANRANRAKGPAGKSRVEAEGRTGPQGAAASPARR